MSDWKLVGKANSVLPGETIIQGSMIVGRVADSDICIPINHMSRKHACIEVVGDSLRLKDLGSSNGTFVNGQKITEVELQPGDIIGFDQEEFVVQGPVSTDEGDDDATVLRPVSNLASDEASPASIEAEKAQAAKLAAEEAVAAAAAAQVAAEQAFEAEQAAVEKAAAEKAEQAAAEQAAAEQAAAEQAAAEQAAAEQAAAEQAAAEQAAAEQAAAEQAAAEQAAAEKAAAEKAAAEKAAAEKAAAEKAAAEKAAAEKAAAEKAAAEQAAAEQAAAEQAAAEKVTESTQIDSSETEDSDATMVMPRPGVSDEAPAKDWQEDEDSAANATMIMPAAKLKEEAPVNDWQEGEDSQANKTMVMNSMPDAESQSASNLETDLIPELKCKTKPYSGEVFRLTNRVNSIGRTNENDIELNDPSVSSKHAEIVIDNGICQIKDTGSYNGVFVNKKKYQIQALRSGDLINIGRMKLVFSDGSESGSGGVKDVLSSVSLPELPVKAIAAVVAVIVVAVLAYMIVPGLLTSSSEVASSSWNNISSERANPGPAVMFDVNNDGTKDIIVAGESGVVDVINGGNGSRLSQINTEMSLYSSPLLVDVASDNQMDVITVARDGNVKAHTSNGQLLWSNNEFSGQSFIAPAVTAKITGDNVDDIVIATEKNGIVFLDGNNGTQLTQITSLNGRVITRPLVDDFNGDGITEIVVITDQQQISAFSVQNNQVRQMWSQSIPPVLTAPAKYAVINGMGIIFVATQSNGLLTLNSQTGGKIWQAQIEGLLFAEPVTMDTNGDKEHNFVVQTTHAGNIVALDTSSGDKAWEITLANKVQTPASVISSGENTQLLLADTEGMIYIVDAIDGNIDFSTKVEQANRFVVAPLVGQITANATQSVVLTSQNGNVFVYDSGVR